LYVILKITVLGIGPCPAVRKSEIVGSAGINLKKNPKLQVQARSKVAGILTKPAAVWQYFSGGF